MQFNSTKRVGDSLPATLVFDYGSLEALADFLLREKLDRESSAPALHAADAYGVSAASLTLAVVLAFPGRGGGQGGDIQFVMQGPSLAELGRASNALAETARVAAFIACNQPARHGRFVHRTRRLTTARAIERRPTAETFG